MQKESNLNLRMTDMFLLIGMWTFSKTNLFLIPFNTGRNQIFYAFICGKCVERVTIWFM